MKLYVLYLRAYSVLLLIALFAVVMPTSWMMVTAEWLEVTLVDNPLNGYLTRSLSLMYALVGVVLLYSSFDVARYWPLLRFLGWTIVVFGGLMLAIDLAVAMPATWTWGDGPTTSLSGGLMLWLQQRAAAELDARD